VLLARGSALLSQLLANFRGFPWRSTLLTLRQRFREDRLGLTASSLTFTTSLALVPLISVALTAFSAFPMFAQMQQTFQQWLAENLVPESISRPVLNYVVQFSKQASRLGLAGGSALLVSAIALVFTIDGAINRIWRVSKARPFSQRLLTYWAALTLGPLLLAASITLGNTLLRSSSSIGPALLQSMQVVLNVIEFIGLTAALAAIYRFLPNTVVRWADAVTGALIAALAFEGAKVVLAWYLKLVPTYSAVYGTFATVPILLIWIYLAWLIVLFGAVIVAYLPSLRAGVAHRGQTPGWQFQCALEILELLDQSRTHPRRGLAAAQIAQRLRVDALQLQQPLDTLRQLDWIGLLDDPQRNEAPRYVLLANLHDTPLTALEKALLFDPHQVHGQAASNYLSARAATPVMAATLLEKP
jgi:membrane protein